MECAICRSRHQRRFCPGVRGGICSICCGAEREVTVSCPLDCEYLREARLRQKLLPLDEGKVPNKDIVVPENFLEEHEMLVVALAGAVARAALSMPGAVDRDAREAIDGLIRTYRTLESGVYYDSRPANTLAAAIFEAAQAAVADFRDRERQDAGLARTRDSDVLKTLVLLERVEIDRNNGRVRGRAFLDSLHSLCMGGEDPEPAPSSSLILP